MTPERIAYGIAERLRERGVEFNEADVAAFVADIPPLEGHPDFDALATRFAKNESFYTRRRVLATRLLAVGRPMAYVGAANCPIAAASAFAAGQHYGELNPLPWGIWIGAGLALLFIGGAFTIYGRLIQMWPRIRARFKHDHS